MSGEVTISGGGVLLFDNTGLVGGVPCIPSSSSGEESSLTVPNREESMTVMENFGDS